MKRNVAWTILCLAMLFVCVRAAAWEDDHTCSASGVAGQWGYSETGTVMTPNGPVPYSSLGRYTLDRDGNYSGARTATIGGNIQKATFTGTATVKLDCTGKITIKFYDLSGTLLNTVVKAVVYVNNETEAHAIVTSVVLPNGASVLTVLTTEANKLFFEDEH